ncbi:MAG: hypothetical protein ACOCYB_01255 [Alkalispirochaeta sp.]
MAGLLHRDAPGNGRFFVSSLRRRITGTLTLLVGAGLLGCSSADPQIMQVDHYVVVSATAPEEAVIGTVDPRRQAPATDVGEALIVSVDVFDADGSGELAELDVRLPEADLYWTIDVEDLSYHEQDGQQWYTTSPLVIDGLSRVPRGPVLITVTDLSGRQDRREVQLPRTLPEPTQDLLARMDATGTIVPAEDAESLTVVVESEEGRRDVRHVSDVSETVLVTDVFDEASLQRLRDAEQPVRVWVLHDWGTRIQSESGPWALHLADLAPSDES